MARQILERGWAWGTGLLALGVLVIVATGTENAVNNPCTEHPEPCYLNAQARSMMLAYNAVGFMLIAWSLGILGLKLTRPHVSAGFAGFVMAIGAGLTMIMSMAAKGLTITATEFGWPAKLSAGEEALQTFAVVVAFGGAIAAMAVAVVLIMLTRADVDEYLVATPPAIVGTKP